MAVVVIGASAALPAWWALLGGAIAVIVGQSLGRLLFVRLSKNHERYLRTALGLLLLISFIAIGRGLLELL